jgi:hypothetical protein
LLSSPLFSAPLFFAVAAHLRRFAPVSSASPDNAPEAPDWTVVAVLYLALALGIGGLLYVGNYRNAVWLALIGTGGGLTAYGRVLQARGRSAAGRRWTWAAGAVYGVFFLWAGAVLLRALLR